ncbi:hypothetical protein STSP2_03132 [Anaerohalosphaera lusitana]|uniref:Uncharacterized protein n=1 Tax=Anaerohalosphaera lusitana TaxID=1936003 RepID=A0A1U9NPR9_9BACT|nr:hypothetical protein [Anaerohalosphaera lusitana]AQT69932.1 hypothetical protein STSP2_03132 [Anaerohalosphaera lusitana]
MKNCDCRSCAKFEKVCSGRTDLGGCIGWVEQSVVFTGGGTSGSETKKPLSSMQVWGEDGVEVGVRPDIEAINTRCPHVGGRHCDAWDGSRCLYEGGCLYDESEVDG